MHPLLNNMRYILAAFNGALMMAVFMFIDDQLSNVNDYYNGLKDTNKEEDTNNHQSASVILPDKVFTIVGLEESGSQLFTEILVNALFGQQQQKHQDDRYGSGTLNQGISSAYHNDGNFVTEIQHFTLPFTSSSNTQSSGRKNGATCRLPTNESDTSHTTIPLVSSWPCLENVDQNNDTNSVLFGRVTDQCLNFMMGQEQQQQPQNENNGFPSFKSLLFQQQKQSEAQYFLNITSHFEWHRERGIDANLIIVVRDKSIAKKARLVARERPCGGRRKDFLRDVMQKEEEIATQIIDQAIAKYITPPTQKSPSNVNDANIGVVESEALLRKRFGSALVHQEGNRRTRRRLLGAYETDGNNYINNNDNDNNSFINHNDGKVILVSYEMLHNLKDLYIQHIYDNLDIDSEFSPSIDFWEDDSKNFVDEQLFKKVRQEKADAQKRMGRPGSVAIRRPIARNQAINAAKGDNEKSIKMSQLLAKHNLEVLQRKKAIAMGRRK